MIFVILLLFSPFVTSSFTSMCPPNPNTVTVNCNNQNPFPFFPGTTMPVRARVLDIGYNKPPVGSKLELELHRSDSSEESSERDDSSSSDESSEEINDQHIPIYPITPVSNPQVPSFHPATTINNRLDFMRRGMGGVFRSNLRNVPRNQIEFDETHGHGHSGQYNHNQHYQGHNHDYNHHEHNHGHNHNGYNHEHNHHGYNHGHNPIYNNGHIPELTAPSLYPSAVNVIGPLPIPSLFPHPSTTISGAHIIPEHVLPIGNIHNGGGIYGRLNVNREDLRNPTLQVTGTPTASGTTTGQYNQGVDLLHDTHDRLILTRRGYRALKKAKDGRRTYELYPQDSLNRFIDVMSFPTISQDGSNTEISCNPIPITQTEYLPVTAEAVSTVNTETLPIAQGSSSLITSENVNSHTSFPQSHGESTVTTVTTTKVDERPISTDIRVPIEESSGSTVTKVTTTKTDERPVETIVHGTSAQTGTTVTKVTTTKTEGRPIITNFNIPVEHNSPIEGSTVTKVTTTTTENRPVTTDLIGETFVQGTPIVQTGSDSSSTITKVTTTKEQPTGVTIPETIANGESAQSGTTITKVTTTTTSENRPNSNLENLEAIFERVPDVVSGKPLKCLVKLCEIFVLNLIFR